MSAVGVPGPHSAPHFNAAGFCVCSCAECIMRCAGYCTCLDCPCDEAGPRSDEHEPPGGWQEPAGMEEVLGGETVVASMPGGLGPPGWLRP